MTDTISLDKIEASLRYVELGVEDAVALRQVRSLVEAHSPAFIDRFYAHLLKFKGTHKFLTDQRVVQRLLQAQRDYLLSLFDANFDEAYFRHRRTIGQTHFRIGLDFRWYIGAYTLYLGFFMPLFQKELIAQPERLQAVQAAFRKATLLDMSIVLEAYHEGDKAALAAATSQVVHQEKLAAIGLLASGLAHEIGNPLASIQVICENQLMQPLEPPIAEKFQRIFNQVDRIVSIVRKLVSFARRDPDKWKPVAVNDEIEGALAVAKLSRSAKTVEIRQSLGQDVPATIAIGDQLSQVFLNLFLNAFDAMREQGGVLEISSEYRDGRIFIRVKDNGVGIDEENLKNLFMPFFTTKEVGKGTGLGLHVSDGIVKRHGGKISVISGLEAGTEFLIELPQLMQPPKEETQL